MDGFSVSDINEIYDIDRLKTLFVSYVEETEKIIEQEKRKAREYADLYDWLLEQLRQLKRDRFGKKSESIFNLQISLFEDEKKDDETNRKEKLIEVAPHCRKIKTRADFSNLEKEVFHHDLQDKNCPKCSNPLSELKPTIKEVIRYEKGRYVLEEHIIHNYVCNKCNAANQASMYSGENYHKLIDSSIVSPSLMASIIDDKFTRALPLYRQEQDLARNGISINRQNMSNWLSVIAQNYISVLTQLMNRDLLEEDIIYGDETTLNCLEFKDRSKSYIWVRCSSPSSTRQIRLFDFSRGRDFESCKKLYEGYKGYLHCDAYATYRRLEGVTIVACMAHARRYVFEAISTSKLYILYEKLPDDKSRRSFLNEHESFRILIDLLSMIDDLFKLERGYKAQKLDHEAIRQSRLEQAKPILEKIRTCIDMYKDSYLKKSKAGEAMTYLDSNYDQLCNYLLDGRLELTNSLAERTIKNVVIGRKNFLFANTNQGAVDACMYYSLIETAKANGLNPYRYVKYILEKMINVKFDDEEFLRSLLPYSDSLPRELRSAAKTSDSIKE